MPRDERELIRRIRSLAAKTAGGSGLLKLINSIGDDCAVLRPRRNIDLVVTTDFSLEGTHFRREWHPAESVGHRCLARGLSDIAAMGAEPVAAFLSLALPASLSQRWVDGFFHGFLALARRYKVVLAGGDTSESDAGVLADIVVVGAVPRGKSIRRSGAKPGDVIYMTGELGRSFLTLQQLMAGKKLDARKSRNARHFYPEPRVAVGRWLGQKAMATAMIDTSDGLSTDLFHVCEESGVSAAVWAANLPMAQEIRVRPNWKSVLHAGEDYELLFTAPASRRVPVSVAGVAVTPIGEILRREKKGARIMLIERGRGRPLEPRGWQHFSRRSKTRQS
jgi:thiamine-monophosphate kinase